MIIKVKNSKAKPKKILITSSSTSDFDKVSAYYAEYDSVVGKDGYVYLITDEKQEKVLKRVNRLTCTLPSINLKMCTGLIVDFRLKGTWDQPANFVESSLSSEFAIGLILKPQITET